jgi:putative hydrolase of the HAD superfamily/5'-nucleotidase
MNRTFMFDEDNFGPDEDFHTTYRALGGRLLSKEEVQTSIRTCFDTMLGLYQLPENFDNFPSVAETLRRQNGVSETELALLEQVFAKHEQGIVPPAYAELLRRLSRTHQLGIVSNLWSRKEPWLAQFERIGIADVFTCKIFSSDSRSIKPSPVLFKTALQSFSSAARILFVGDNLERDIKPAKSLGLATAWLTTTETGSPYADYVLPDLLQIG